MSGSRSEDEEPHRPLRIRPVHALDRDSDGDEVVVIESDEEDGRECPSQSVVGPSQSVSTTASMASTQATQAKRSFVWSYFEPLPCGKKAKCKICGLVMVRTTSSMAMHLAGENWLEAEI